MSWPPSPQNPAYPEPPEGQYPGYSGQSHPTQPGQSYPTQPGQPYPTQPGQPYPGYSQSSSGYQNPGQSSGYPGQPYGYPQSSDQSAGYPGQPAGYPQSSSGYPQSSPGFTPDPSQSSSPHPQPPTQPKKSKAGKIVLIVLAVVLVLCGGGATALYFTVGDDVKGVAEATKTRVVAPDTLAGRPKITKPELQSAADQMVGSIKKDVPQAKDVVGAFYGDPAKQDMVMVAAASALLADPGKELDEAINGAGQSLNMTDVKAVDPGPQGGQAKCGNAKSEGIDMAVCVWADRGSLGMVVIYFTKADEKAIAEFVTMRGEIEKTA